MQRGDVCMLPGEVELNIARAAVNEGACEDSNTEHV